MDSVEFASRLDSLVSDCPFDEVRPLLAEASAKANALVPQEDRDRIVDERDKSVQDREAALEAREKALAEREAATSAGTAVTPTQPVEPPATPTTPDTPAPPTREGQASSPGNGEGGGS